MRSAPCHPVGAGDADEASPADIMSTSFAAPQACAGWTSGRAKKSSLPVKHNNDDVPSPPFMRKAGVWVHDLRPLAPIGKTESRANRRVLQQSLTNHFHLQLVDVSATLVFSDSELERDFCSSAFRQAFVFHMATYMAQLLVLMFGFADVSFEYTATALLPLALAEIVLRIVLHRMQDHTLAQHLGARLILVLTTISWIVYVLASYGQCRAPAGQLITALLPLTLLIYPAKLGFFMLAPKQKAFGLAVAIMSITGSQTWSALSKAEELCLHGLAIGIGIAVAYPLERALREIALLQLQESVHQQTKLEEELHLALHESEEVRI